MHVVVSTLKIAINILKVFYYTDSVVTLFWIMSCDKEFKSFIKKQSENTQTCKYKRLVIYQNSLSKTHRIFYN